MVSGKLGGPKQVIAAHVMPHSAKVDTLEYAGISRDEVNSARNCILLAVEIENAFDRLDVSFVPLDLMHQSRFLLKVWTPRGLQPGCIRKGHPGDVRSVALWPGCSSSIGDFEGVELFCGANSVLKRALSFQAWHAYHRAKSEHWEAASAAPVDFGSLSPDRDVSQFQRSREIVLRALGDPEALGAAAAATAAAAAASEVSESVAASSPYPRPRSRSDLSSSSESNFLGSALDDEFKNKPDDL
jgi:hypothetical protein